MPGPDSLCVGGAAEEGAPLEQLILPSTTERFDTSLSLTHNNTAQFFPPFFSSSRERGYLSIHHEKRFHLSLACSPGCMVPTHTSSFTLNLWIPLPSCVSRPAHMTCARAKSQVSFVGATREKWERMSEDEKCNLFSSKCVFKWMVGWLM